MKLKKLNGVLVYKNVVKYRIDWNKKERSIFQTKVKNFLEQFWRNHIVYSEFPVYGTKMTLDFFNATCKISVEADGKQHDAFNKFFHSNNRLNYLKQIKHDMAKEKFCEINKIFLCRIRENEINDLSRQFFIDKFNLYL